MQKYWYSKVLLLLTKKKKVLLFFFLLFKINKEMELKKLVYIFIR